ARACRSRAEDHVRQSLRSHRIAGRRAGRRHDRLLWSAQHRCQGVDRSVEVIQARFFAALRATGFFAAALAALAALRSARFGSTAALKPAPGTNFGTFMALIFTASPVLGLKPVRAARLARRNVPKPTKLAVSPFFTAATMEVKTVSRMRPAPAFERSCSAASFSTSSMRFMDW